ncbi:cellulose synthase-like protein E2 isoform X2 [Salvia splendens]|uniref:cellulose synthase-like protein E2 isoform X2 n=1 Tax=Salvia splendens TaxID=180675 RepID=UPI001C278E57|nr:cellulose synthase-like protein E2 isoform X2 [Salvia splendens]
MLPGMHHDRHEGRPGAAHEMGFRFGTSRPLEIQPSHLWRLEDASPSSLVLRILRLFPLHIRCLFLVRHGFPPMLLLRNRSCPSIKVTSPWFAVFAGAYASSAEVKSSGGTVRTMWNEQRIWIIRAVTACLFGCVDVLMKYAGVAKANFRLTNKVVDQEKLDKYQKGKFDFQGAKMFMVPLTLLVLINLGCFVGGAKGLVARGNVAEMFGQGMLSMYVLLLSFPILQGLVPRLGK